MEKRIEDIRLEKWYLNREQMIAIMVETAARFVEFFDDSQYKWFKRCDYKGEMPVRFRPSLGDKLIFRHIAHVYLNGLPEDWWDRHNATFGGMEMLFWDFYPFYFPLKGDQDEL